MIATITTSQRFGSITTTSTGTARCHQPEMLTIAEESLNHTIAHADSKCPAIADTPESKQFLEIYADYRATLQRLADIKPNKV